MSLADVVRTVRTARAMVTQTAGVLAPPVLRVALAVPFFRSGLTKWDGFSLAPTAVFLFQDEFRLHLFGGLYHYPAPAAFALFDAIAEIALPIMLVLGLATRFSALGLLAMAVIIQLTVPAGWADFHLPWAAMAIAIIALGPGGLSVDALIGRTATRTTSSG